MNLYLVRHAETAHNRNGVGLGRLDEPLTDLGMLQAASVAERFTSVKLDRLFTSPLRRALETARAIGAGYGVPAAEVRDELIEMDVGLTEGMAFSAVRERFPDFAERWAGPEVAKAVMPGGESLEDVALRLAPLVGKLREFPPDAGVAVVSHNFVMKVLLCSLLSVDLSGFRTFEVGLASVSTLSLRGVRVNVVGLNDTCHLLRLNLDHPQRSV
ncbi:MAG: histidine phosphatase family protein [Anaerolineaceae bacterium]